MAGTPRRHPVAIVNRPLAGPAAVRFPHLRIGLLGGSFNPAHEGHLWVSLEAMRHLHLDRIWWLVSPQNPLKPRAGMGEFEARLASARAVAKDPRVIVSDLEHRLGTRYTVDTLRWLQRHCRERFVWLMGADNLLQLPRWSGWHEIMERVPIAVMDREPYFHRAMAGRVATTYARARIMGRDVMRLAALRPPVWAYLRLRRHRASSTAIRARQQQVQEGETRP